MKIATGSKQQDIMTFRLSTPFVLVVAFYLWWCYIISPQTNARTSTRRSTSWTVMVAASSFNNGNDDVASTATANTITTRRLPPTIMVNPQTAANNKWLPSSISIAQADANEIPWKDVVACCHDRTATRIDDAAFMTCSNNDDPDEADGACNTSNAIPKLETVVIGQMPQFRTQDTIQVLDAAAAAWKGGMGMWPQMSLAERCRAIRHYLQLLQQTDRRQAMIHTLMWEIGKNSKDASAEFDRTIQFAEQVMDSMLQDPEFMGVWQTVGSTTALIRRSPMGIILALAPFNYPLNEAYAMIIPALLNGNIVILKLPTTGGLVHLLTLEPLRQALPPGTISFVSGSGRATMPPLMQTGRIDGLAFIGSSRAADALIQAHPHPHRLKTFLQLEGKNMGIFLPDLFENSQDDALGSSLYQHALNEAVLGSLSFNGQRCTALKLLFVPAQHAESFVTDFVTLVTKLKVGLPWEEGVQITPLPTPQRIQYMQELINDAVNKGAQIINPMGGNIIGGKDSTLMVPAVLYPVTPDMRVYQEEQFGPVVPITVYDDTKDNNFDKILSFVRDGEYGQQVSIFGQDAGTAAMLVDRLNTIVGRINLNGQCARSPDTLPFTGRRSSAMGTMSVTAALREFSVPVVVAYRDNHQVHDSMVPQVQQASVFLQPL